MNIQIRVQLEQLRPIMIDLGMSLGLTHPATLRVSEAIDALHNELLKEPTHETRIH